jgi:hypothetical protein
VPLEEAVSFDSNGILGPGITHTPGTAEITVLDAGIYAIDFSASTTEPSQLALFADGTVIPGAIYGSGAGTQQNAGQVIVALPANSVITLRNHTSAAAVGFQAGAGGTQPSVNASIAIEKIAEAL